MNTFDRSLLTDYSSRMLDRFLPAFPDEVLYSIENSENYFQPDGDRLKGAWVIEWLCPAGGYDWNVRLRSTREGVDEQLTIIWGDTHTHFGYWTNTKPDEEADDCLKFLNDIFQEKIWNIGFLNENVIIQVQMCEMNEIQIQMEKYQANGYKVKSWRSTYDKKVGQD
ncbi:MAG: hypothetical protein JEZ00_20585 [Anaerolineaceae bacterium]|nr:hypothetical protein [Anaerolineaceae bacterium]